MTTGERLATMIGVSRIIGALGVVFIASALVRGVGRINAGAPVTSALFVSLFITVPGLLLIYGGYWLPKADLRPEFYPTIAKWCVGGAVAMLLFLGVYHLVVEGGMNNPGRAIPILTSFSSLAGFGLGLRDAQTKTREREVEETVERLRESNNRLEQFAYAASHDLQEPLRMISSYLQLIETRAGDDLSEENQEFLEFAVDGADRMRAMINGLLEYSRIDSEGEPFTPVELDEVVDDVTADLQVPITESDAEITVDELPRVDGDRSQLHQLLQNLVSNAIEYSPDGPPQIHISAMKNRHRWIVSVQDDGIGIEPEDQDRIFEIFNRLHSRDEHPGTGIGLALCERIVERHRGEIWVESEPNEGATFSFSLPAAGFHEN